MKREPKGQFEDFLRDELRQSLAEAPSFEELAAYVEGRLDPEARALLEERLAADATLRQEVEDLRVLQAQMARPSPVAIRPSRVRYTALAAALAVAASLVLWLWPDASGPGPGGPPPIDGSPLAALHDGAARVVLAADGSLTGLRSGDTDTRAAVAAALRGVLPSPRGLEPLQSSAGRLLGPSTPGAFAPLTPLGTRVGSDRPTFRWTPHPGARTYEVSLFDEDLRPQLASGPLAGTEWTPARGLARGRVYLWQVTAATGTARVTAPAPPAPEARFEVASEAVLAGVGRRRAADPASHLVAAVALVEAGLLDDAEAELRALEARNPGSAELARLQAALQSLRARPRSGAR